MSYRDRHRSRRRRSFSREYERGGRYNRRRSRSRDRGRDRRRDRRGSRDRGYGRRDRRRSPDPIHQPLDEFRFRDLSLERPTNEQNVEACVELKEKEVAYVFGRMGTTKDKLARVSGANIKLEGQDLIIQGSERVTDRAKKYVQILLDQRHGDVYVNPKDHPDDLTFVDVPSNCKGFITGRGGATLRQIERECATLMTFCKSEDREGDREPLAIFGTRRGRLLAQLKVMSVVEGKAEGFYTPDEERPKVSILDCDIDEGDGWGVQYLKLGHSFLGYALGQKGNTRQKLQIASGSIMQYIGMWAVFGGTKEEQTRGKDYLEWLLDQRNSDFSVDIRGRTDVSIIYVPEPSVGYVTGKKAATLRSLEQKSGTFCFFDKRKSGKVKEKMLIFSSRSAHRERAVEEVEMIVNFHQNKIRGGQRVTFESDSRSASRDNSRSRSGSKSRSRSRSRGRKSRSRSFSRDRSFTRSPKGRKEKKSPTARDRSFTPSPKGRKEKKLPTARDRSFTRSPKSQS